MEVFALTIFVSLAFAVLFAVLFIAERCQRTRRSIEQTALLPLDDDYRSLVRDEQSNEAARLAPAVSPARRSH